MVAEHQWYVCVYVGTGDRETRAFGPYLTERDASGYAEHLRAQAKANGWNYQIRVQRRVTA